MKVVRVLAALTVSAVLFTTGAAWSAEFESRAAEPSAIRKAPAATIAKEYTLPFPQGRIFHPRISGDWVVALYNDIRSTGPTGQLLAHNLSTKKMYTPWESGAGHPDVDGNLAVFTGRRNAQETYPTLNGKPSKQMPSNLVVCDLITGRYYCPEIGTVTAAEPVISGRKVAYTSGGHVFLVDLETGVNRQISDPTKGDQNTGLSINGDYVAWTTSCDPNRLYYYRISTGEMLTVDSSPAAKGRDTSTDGRYIVWTGVTSDNGNHFFDTTTGQTGRCTQGAPGDIENGLEVYLNPLKGDRRQFVHGLYFPLTGPNAFLISTDAANEAPCVSGNRVVWVGNNTVYCAELVPGKPVSTPLSAP